MSSGFPSVQETCRRIGITFDGWQSDLNRCILAKTADGLYAADTVVLSIARQVGKTFDVGAVVFALCIAQPDLTVVWTAHRFKVARETFTALRGLAKSPLLVPHLDYDEITTAAGNESIPFRNGSRIVFAARERGTIRGFTKVAVLVLDEAQILTEAALADLAPTLNQAENPLVVLMGTPPKPSDPSEVFTGMREDALAGSSSATLYVELSADEDADPEDRGQWRKANPSFPVRTPERAIERLRKLLTVDDFRREALGIWDASGASQIPPELWAARADRSGEIVGRVSFALALADDQSWAVIAAAGFRGDGLAQVEVVDNRPGALWVVDRLVELTAAWPSSGVVLNPGGPAGALVGALTDRRVSVVEVSARELAQACGEFLIAVVEGTVRHRDEPVLNSAVRLAGTRASADAWVFSQRHSTSDISPLLAAVLALHGLQEAPKPAPAVPLMGTVTETVDDWADISSMNF